jgi:hypothetical protein
MEFVLRAIAGLLGAALVIWMLAMLWGIFNTQPLH